MERQFTELDTARKLIDDIIKTIEDEETKRCAYVHLYGTGLMASFLAIKRGYSRKIAEMAEIAGMLHDLLKYVDKKHDTKDHAHKCADYAKEKVIDHLEGYTEEEKKLIYNGIYNHSDKNSIGTSFDTLIKDADDLQHCFRNPVEDYWFNNPRIKQIIYDLF